MFGCRTGEVKRSPEYFGIGKIKMLFWCPVKPSLIKQRVPCVASFAWNHFTIQYSAMYAMPFFTAFLCSILFIFSASAQEVSSRHEAGLQFSGVNFKGDNTFNFIFKKALDEHRFRRFRAAFGQLDVIYADKKIQSSLEAGIYFGVEKRKKAGDRLVFYDGWEVGADLGRYNDNRDFSQWVAGIGIGYVIGLQHEFNDRWAISLETVPGIRSRFSKARDEKLLMRFSAGFSSLAALAIVRMF